MVERILVVDDEERVLFVLCDALTRMGDGYEVVAAEGGEEALEELSRSSFDLIITDLRMPGLDGVELTERARATAPDTVIVWVTAYGCRRARDDAIRLGVYRCLDKPIEISEIRQVARQALEESR